MLSLRLFLSLSAAVVGTVHAQSRVEDNDIPQQCRSTCQPLIDQSRNCDDQYSSSNDNNNNNLGNQNYQNCICGAQNAANYIPQCDSCIVQDPNYLNNNNGATGYNNNGYNEVNQWMQICNFPNTNYNGVNGGGILNPTPTLGGYVNPTGVYPGENGYGMAYQTIYDQNGNPETIQTPIPTAGGYYGNGGNGGYVNGGGYGNGYITTYDQYGNPQVIQTGSPSGGYYPGNVVGGNLGDPISVSYTTTTSTDQFGQRFTFVTPVSTHYASLTTSWSRTRSTDAFGHTQTYSVPYVAYTGAANPVAAAKAVVGAGAGLLMAALAF